MKSLLVCLALAGAIAPAQVPKPPWATSSSGTTKPTSRDADAQEPDTTFKVDVKLVNVFVTVTDDRGAPIASLKKENFALQEYGKEQKIAVFDKESALPLSIVLAIDTSLSTRKDLPLELSSAKKFAHTILRAQDGLAVYKFSETVSQMVGFTNELKKIDEGIE